VTGVLDLYVREQGPLHRLDERAKLFATAGFAVGALMAPTRPIWSTLVLLGLLLSAMVVGRVPAMVMGKRLMGLALVVGLPFVFSRFGGEQTRAAGETFAVKSLLVAGGFVVLTASTRAADMLEATGRVPLLAGLSGLSEFVLRGMHVLSGEVMRTNRAWALRAPHPGLRVRLSGLMAASVNLVGRAAARSDRVGAAMVLRGFDGRLPSAPARPIPVRDLLWGAGFGLACLVVGGAGQWW
jgi:energy-coupling factor transporter transmembrane protein EcfT